MVISSKNGIKLMGILRDVTKSQVNPIIQASIDGGLRTFEIALNTRDAFHLISIVREHFDDTVFLGAGTVVTKVLAKDAISAGASFLVAPNYNKEVALFAQSQNVSYIPGALTPTEVYTAWKISRYMVKIFPASVFGPRYFKQLHGPYKEIQLMAVGGITLENVKDYFIAGASGVALGEGSIYRKEWIVIKDWQKIQEAVNSFVRETNLIE